METNEQPKYLLRFEAYQRTPLMLASWKQCRIDVIEQAHAILNILPFEKCEIWCVDIFNLVAIVEKK